LLVLQFDRLETWVGEKTSEISGQLKTLLNTHNIKAVIKSYDL